LSQQKTVPGDRHGVAVRDRSEIAELHGAHGKLEGRRSVTLENGDRLPFSLLFCFLGAKPCTGWLNDAVVRAPDGFVLTGDAVGADRLLRAPPPNRRTERQPRAGVLRPSRSGAAGQLSEMT
jgi:hypothetical protein